MNNSNNQANDKKDNSSDNKTLAEINQVIDDIISKHKEKIEEIQAKKADIEKISLKNKNGKTIYYLRKNKNNKEQDQKSKNISKKIITEAKKNLGKDIEEDTEFIKEDTNQNKEKKKKVEKKIKFGKKFKNLEDIDNQPIKSEEMVKSREFDEVVNEIDNLIIDDSDKKSDRKAKQSKDEKDIDFVTSSTDDLAGLKIVEEENIDLEKTGKDFSDYDTDLSDQDILREDKKDTPVETINVEDENIYGKESKKLTKQQKKDKKREKKEAKKIKKEKKGLLRKRQKQRDTEEKNKNIDFNVKGLPNSEEYIDDESLNLDEKIKNKSLSESEDEFYKKEKKDTTEDIDIFKEKKSFFKKKQDLEKEKINKSDSDKTDFIFDNQNNTDINQEDESKLLDKEIEKPDQNQNNEILEQKKQITQKDKDDINIFNENKGFFKKKKTVDKKDIKEQKNEDTTKKQEIKPMFRVENLPASDIEDDADILDEKIKETSDKKNKVDENKIAEAKALELAKEHIKQKSFLHPQQEPVNEKNIKDETDKIIGKPLNIEGSEHEHVFFDETEKHVGWSPQLSDDEKKKMSIPFEGRPETDPGDLKPGQDIELPKEVLKTKSVALTDLGFSEHEWEELDFYTLHEPFAFVEILREKESLDKCYFLVEIELTEEEKKILCFIQDSMAWVDFDTNELEVQGDDKYLTNILDQVVEEYNINIKEESKKKIIYYIGKAALGLGKLDPLMADPNIEDISCDGAGVPIFLYHRRYGSLKSNVKFNDEEELSSFVFRLAQKCGKHISIAEPMLDATMPDGSRIQMTLSDEITAKGSTFTIRKFREDPFSPPDLVEFNTMSSEMVAYMWLAVENGINTLFAGGTASGKTTALNALSLFIPRESKIVSIEETREINLPHPNWIPGVARSGFGEAVADKIVGQIDMYDLMKAALRQRPEYILVGEIRGREAYVLFQAMATGHATYSTVHADSAQSLIHRLEGKPIEIPRVMLQSLDVVCLHVITRVKDKRARRCKQIIEIIDIDPTTKEILTNEVFRWDPVEDNFVYSGKSYVLERVRADKDMNREEMTDELRKRKEIVEWMNNTNVRAFREVANLVARYLEAPEETFRQIKKDVKK